MRKPQPRWTAATQIPGSRPEATPTKAAPHQPDAPHPPPVGASSACEPRPHRTAATQIRRSRPEAAPTKAAPVPTRRTTPVPCRSKLCLRTAAALNHSHAKPRSRPEAAPTQKQRASRKARRVNNRPAVPALFSGRKKTSNFVGGGGSSRSKSGPLGRGPEICQHLTQQGASKGFYTLRSLRPICCSASSMRMEIFFLQTPTLSPAAAGTVASRAIIRLPG